MRNAYFFYLHNYRSDAFLKTLVTASPDLLVFDFSLLRTVFRKGSVLVRKHYEQQCATLSARNPDCRLRYIVVPAILIGRSPLLHRLSLIVSIGVAAIYAVVGGIQILFRRCQRVIFYNGHPLFLPALITTRLRKIRILTDLGDILYLLENRNPITLGLEMRFLRWSETIICVTRAFRNHLVNHHDLPPDRIQVLSAAIPEKFPEAFSETANHRHRANLRIRIKTPSDALVLGYAGDRWFRSVAGRGRIDVQGVDFLCRMVVHLNQTGTETHLVLVGVDGQHSDLNGIVSGPFERHFHFLGRYRQLDPLHCEALGGVDALCLPSVGSRIYHLYDRFKMYEYMAAGKRIIAADLPINREILPPETLYYPESKLEGMAAAVRDGIASGFPVYMATSGQRVSDRYTWEQRLEDGTLAKILDGQQVARD